MKKFLCLLVLVAMVASMLVACVGSFTCDLCGKDKTGRKYTEELLGEKIEYCSDCKEGLEELGDMFG